MAQRHIRILAAMMDKDFSIVREAFIARARIESARRLSVPDYMAAQGYEQVQAENQLTDDGREVVHINNRAYALSTEIHAERLAAAFEAAKKARPETETKSVAGTETLSSMTCPKCGDALQHTAVCPKCAAGKLGYRHRYTCVCGGVDLISKDKL